MISGGLSECPEKCPKSLESNILLNEILKNVSFPGPK